MGRMSGNHRVVAGYQAEFLTCERRDSDKFHTDAGHGDHGTDLVGSLVDEVRGTVVLAAR